MAERVELPSYEHPPVVEVVFGTTFEPFGDLLAPHFGRFWDRLDKSFDQVQEVPPLAPVREVYGELSEAELEVSDRPPLPRVWFSQSAGSDLIQLQRDRFLYNWRKGGPKDTYPRFPETSQRFSNYFAIFSEFVAEELGRTPEDYQYELTYINHIAQGQGWASFQDIGDLLPDFSWRRDASRFLPEPENFVWRNVYPLPKQMGRLHVTIRPAQVQDTGENIIRLDLTVRGMRTGEPPAETMQEWFAEARRWIVFGFTDMTSSDIQHGYWGRTP